MSSSKQEGGKLLSSRILTSRDRSSSAVANASSFRVYYSLGAGTVPFLWETKPGTPKTTAAADASTDYDASPPPVISPPPSYQSRTRKTYTRRAPSASRPSLWGWMTRWLHVRPMSPSSSSSTDGGHLQTPDSSAADQVEPPRRRAPILLCSCASDQTGRHG